MSQPARPCYKLGKKGVFEVEQVIPQEENGGFAIISTRSITKLEPKLFLNGYKVFKITKKQLESMTYVLPSEFEALYEAANESSEE